MLAHRDSTLEQRRGALTRLRVASAAYDGQTHPQSALPRVASADTVVICSLGLRARRHGSILTMLTSSHMSLSVL